MGNKRDVVANYDRAWKLQALTASGIFTGESVGALSAVVGIMSGAGAVVCAALAILAALGPDFVSTELEENSTQLDPMFSPFVVFLVPFSLTINTTDPLSSAKVLGPLLDLGVGVGTAKEAYERAQAIGQFVVGARDYAKALKGWQMSSKQPISIATPRTAAGEHHQNEGRGRDFQPREQPEEAKDDDRNFSDRRTKDLNDKLNRQPGDRPEGYEKDRGTYDKNKGVKDQPNFWRSNGGAQPNLSLRSSAPGSGNLNAGNNQERALRDYKPSGGTTMAGEARGNTGGIA